MAAATPKAAAIQRVAAVVMPVTVKPLRIMAPAPMKPIPVTTWAATRDGSFCSPTTAKAPAMVNSAAPRATSEWVRSPAVLWRVSRSSPSTAPSASASARRPISSSELGASTGPILSRAAGHGVVRGGPPRSGAPRAI